MLLFPTGGNWDSQFSFITPQFLTLFGGNFPPNTLNIIPIPGQDFSTLPQQEIQELFGWLTPERFTRLQGGRFDPIRLVWITPSGQEIFPGTPDWTFYFGELPPQQLQLLLPNGGDFLQYYNFITPDWIINFENGNINIPNGFNIPVIISLKQVLFRLFTVYYMRVAF